MSLLKETPIYTILCVDDNQSNLFTLNALLSNLKKVRCLEALDAKSALSILLKQDIDLILCDIQMPDINGFELAKMIKSNKRTKDIPIVFVTAVFKNEEFVQQGFEIGAVDYLTKPINDNHLLNKVALYLKVFEQSNKLRHSENKFHDIVQSVSDGVYILDLNFKTTFVNKQAAQILGYSSEELFGVDIHEYISYKDKKNKPALKKDLALYKSFKKENMYESKSEFLIKKDGAFIDVSLTGKLLYTDARPSSYVVIFHPN